jgi:hypothetical protein
MPYPNEHAARLQDPKKFNPATFKRTKGGTIYGSKKVPKTIGIIWGKMRGRDKPADNPIPQSLRFPTKYFTATQAKSWLKKNGIKYTRFEPATKPKQKLSYVDLPKSALTFRQEDIPIKVELAKREDGTTRRRFRMIAHTFKIMDNRGWFGDLVIDREGLKIGRKDKPVLFEHDTSKILGHSDKIKLDDEEGLIAEGFLTDKTEEGARAIGLLDDKFPFQASIYVPPRGRGALQFVENGKSEKVNGYTFKGPGYIIRKSYLREFSLCPLGADENTSVNALSGKNTVRVYLDSSDDGSHFNTSLKGDEEMSLKNLTLEELKEKRPDLVGAVLADADPDPNPPEDPEKDKETPPEDPEKDKETPPENPEKDKETPPENPDKKDEQQALKAERERVSAILSEAEGYKEVKGFNDEVKKLINDGTPVKDAVIKLKDMKIEAMRKGQVPNLGPSSPPKPNLSGKDEDGSKHLARAKEYAEKHKCSLTEALKKTDTGEKKERK